MSAEIAIQRPLSARTTQSGGGGKHFGVIALEHLAGMVAVVIVTFIAFRLRLPLATTAFLFFPIIVVAALKFGFWEATITSLVAVASLDYFFTTPLFSFRMPNPSDWIALGAFEFAGLVVSRLSTDVLDHAIIAER